MRIRLQAVVDKDRRRIRKFVNRHERLRHFRASVAAIARPFAPWQRERHWRQPRRRRLVTVLLWTLGPLLMVIVVLSVVTVLVTIVRGEAWGVTMGDIRERCDSTGFACDVSTSLVFTLAPLLLASLVFVVWRLSGIRRPLVDAAKRRPAEFVETAGNIVGEVIGRDDLCQVLEDDLRDGARRRPHVLIGSVGAGKTAVLVQLTSQLARHGAVPVPIRLRDADDPHHVDFLELARQRFMRETQRSVWPEAERERVWQRLLQNDQIIVLADGLEEVLAESAENKDRDHVIRAAVASARTQGYPLVIASRPHNALVELDAALVHLEPVSEEAALAYIEHDRPGADQQRLMHLVEKAEVVETPLYVQIARELREADLLTPKRIGASSRRLDTRNADRVRLRMALLKTWLDALVDGELEVAADGNLDRVALPRAERVATVYQLAALACCGLAKDTMEVQFDMLLTPGAEPHLSEEPKFPLLSKAVDAGIEKLPDGRQPEASNVRVATTMGVKLGLVEHRRNGVRFRHSLMQAYLGSLVMGAALRDETYWKEALEDPGREFLIALVMFAAGEQAGKDGPTPDVTWQAWVRDRLIDAAKAEPQPPWPKPLELLSAACEIDSIDADSTHRDAPAALVARWGAPARDAATLDVKLRAAARLGDAALRFSDADDDRPDAQGMYAHLFELCIREHMYPVRVAAAQHIGAGGDAACAEVIDRLRMKDEEDAPYLATTSAWLVPMLYGSASRRRGDIKDRLLDWIAPTEPLDLSVEAALAQGFRFAANRRPGNPHERAESRAALAQLALDMLENAAFWYSRLALLHALTLWELAGTQADADDQLERQDHAALVGRWLARADGRDEHRFVVEAAVLAAQALKTRRPEQYLWIDESGVVTKVGSRSRTGGMHATRNLWITPAAGWLALHPRAQQLVADVLIALNLAERGRLDGVEERLRKLNKDLPYCVTAARCDHLMPSNTVGVAKQAPGGTCKGDCPVKLCPYPPKGQQPFRVELSEAFCRNQVSILGQRGLRRAPWQDATKAELRRFWTEMEQRARV